MVEVVEVVVEVVVVVAVNPPVVLSRGKKDGKVDGNLRAEETKQKNL